MAFDFLGIFTKRDLESLQSFLQGELDSSYATVNHLVLEANKLQKTISALVVHANSNGIQFKTFGQSLWRPQQSEVDDKESALLVQKIKEPFYPNLRRHESVEHQIKKLMDKIEQLHERVHYLRIMQSEFRTDIERINSLFNTQNPQLTVEEEAI